MTANRFEFQRQCVARTTGMALNVGCKEDPAHLKNNFPDRIINLDRNDFDEDQMVHEGIWTPIPVDVVHDILNFPWPFEDKEFDLVVLGDILEDLPNTECQAEILKETRRISAHLCVTTPEDGPERDSHHQTTITEERLKTWLANSGWSIVDFRVEDYGFVPRGYFVFAE